MDLSATPLLPTTVELKDKDLAVGVEIGETKKSTVAPRLGGVRVTFPVLTQNARGFTLTGAIIAPGAVAITPNERAVVGYDGALYLEHPAPSLRIEVPGICRGVLSPRLSRVEGVQAIPCQ